jgi:hypothetical protein
MRRITGLNAYAAVTATLALMVALGGSSYAVARHVSAGSGHKGNSTSPVLVLAVSPSGHVLTQAHRAPVTGKPKIKHVGTGAYWFKKIPGMSYSDTGDVAVCSAAAGQPVSVDVSAAGSAKHGLLAITIYKPNGNLVNAEFKCAVWNLDGK